MTLHRNITAHNSVLGHNGMQYPGSEAVSLSQGTVLTRLPWIGSTTHNAWMIVGGGVVWIEKDLLSQEF